jgi:hypothetical protein
MLHPAGLSVYLWCTLLSFIFMWYESLLCQFVKYLGGFDGDLLGKFISPKLLLLGRELPLGLLATQNQKGKGSDMDSLKTDYSRADLERAFKSTRKNRSAGRIGSISGIQNFVAKNSFPPK